jgi:hypothetical protein
MVNTAHIIVSKGVKEELDNMRGTLTWNEYLRSLLAPREVATVYTGGDWQTVTGEGFDPFRVPGLVEQETFACVKRVEDKFDRIIGLLQERNLPSPAQKRTKVWESVELDFEQWAGQVVLGENERARETVKAVLEKARDWFRENWEG